MEDATLQRMIQRLRGELEEARYAIWALESIVAGKPRRGRPPKWISRFKGRRAVGIRAGAVLSRRAKD